MVDDANSAVGAAVAHLRQLRGMTQGQLAEKLGVGSSQIISTIEKGERSLKALEAVKLAGILNVSFAELLSGKQPETPFVHWRGETGHDGSSRAEEEALFLLRCRRYAFVEGLTSSRPVAQLPVFPLDLARLRFEDMDGWAQQVRGAVGLGELPAPQLRQALEERAGVKVFISSLEGGSGAATRGSFGPAILENAREPLHRRAFSLAHELFHLLTWDAIEERVEALTAAERERLESLAEVFASALLMPLSDVRQRVGPETLARPAWHRLLPIAAAFGVSPPALVWRLVNLQLLERATADALLASPRGRAEGAEAGEEPPLPHRYVLLAFQAWADGKISLGKLAELLETNVGLLGRTLSTYGVDMERDVEEAPALPA